MLVLKSPKFFSFKRTLEVIQRGKIDPINYYEAGKWRRCLSYSHYRALVEIFLKNKKIHITTLQGEVDDQVIEEKISKILGFDDPLLGENAIEFKKKQYLSINHVRSIALPNYSSLFETIVQTILGQQVSAIVANKMRANFIIKFGQHLNYAGKKYYIFPNPNSMKINNPKSIRNLGISNVKTRAIMSVAKHFANPEWVAEFTNESTTVERLYNLLTSIYGVGVWTASWVVLRGLRQFDHVPASDLVVRKAMSWWWKKKTLLSASAIEKLTKSFGRNKGLVTYRIMLAYMQMLSGK